MTFPNTFATKEQMANLAAKMFLEIEAVKFRPEEPYTFASGLASPVYIDCRKLISHPRIRSALMDFAVATLYREVGFEKFDSAAGGETAGIPFAAWIADKMSLPMQYVRKKPKGFGRMAQIEGQLKENSKVILIEDLATDGGSKVSFINAIPKSTVIPLSVSSLRDPEKSLDNDFIIDVFPWSMWPDKPIITSFIIIKQKLNQLKFLTDHQELLLNQY